MQGKKREIGENILMSTSRHEVGHFEIPADNIDGLRNFYIYYLAGSLKRAKHKAIT